MTIENKEVEKKKKKIVEYGLVQSTNYNEFYDWVNNRIKLGWEPLGGLSTAAIGTDIVFTQAMVKDADK